MVGFATRPEDVPVPATQDFGVESSSQPKNVELDPKVFQPPRKIPSRFSAPVAGESLTSEPQNMAFEKPPQFVDLEEATEFVWENLNKRDSALKLIALLDKGVPVDGLVKSILFTGFASGKWSPDLAILMGTHVSAMVMAIGEAADIKNVRLKTEKKSKSDKELEDIINITTEKSVEA